MDITRTTAGVGAGCLFVAQAITSLVLPPSQGNSYSGSNGDVTNDTVFVGALVLLATFLVVDGRRTPSRMGFVAGLVAGVGCLMLAAATLVTVAAGRERWDLVFIAGFALVELGLLATVVSRRLLGYAAMVLGVVLVLAFFDAAGGLALGAGVLLATWEVSRPQARDALVSSMDETADVSRQ